MRIIRTCSIQSIRDNQPAITVTMPDAVHVISTADLRTLANGGTYDGDAQELLRVLSRAVLDLIND